MEPVKIIGMGMSRQDLTPEQLAIINRADVLVGGRRHLALFEGLAALKMPITKDLDDLIEFIDTQPAGKQIVVLASGDPLFYGIGSRLIKSLGPQRVKVLPNINSVAAAFARIKEPWHDAVVISAHGRKPESVLKRALQRQNKIVVLTDPANNPAWLASICLNNHHTDFEMCVLEKLGSEDEHVGWYRLQDAAQRVFANPNLVVLKRICRPPEPFDPPVLHLGMRDSDFAHQAGMITKAEIRAVSLSKLCLRAGDVLWDLGAGSGSVAIEAALLTNNGPTIAIEKNPERINDIRANAKRFNLTNLDVVQAELPEGLAELPAPDRIFIGGGGRQLARIIQAGAGHLKQHGRIVANTVLLQSLQTATEMFAKLGFANEVTQIQINRSRSMPWGQRLEAENPVWIIAAERKITTPESPF